jgi:hypothetical protein
MAKSNLHGGFKEFTLSPIIVCRGETASTVSFAYSSFLAISSSSCLNEIFLKNDLLSSLGFALVIN